jgi:DNA gyrase subunit A
MGTVKKTRLSEFSRPRAAGIIAVDLDDGDFLIGVAQTDGKRDIMLFASNGKGVRFPEGGRGGDADEAGRSTEADEGDDADAPLEAEEEGEGAPDAKRGKGAVRATSRNSRGVRGIRLAAGECVVSLVVVEGDGDILTASQKGFGKRTALAEYPKKGRGTQGVTLMRVAGDEKLIAVERLDVIEADDLPAGEAGMVADQDAVDVDDAPDDAGLQ